tara:strand:+ start:138 stop:344 length:207 start_codon:yes stop_codon:yes gene_type:complete
VGSFKKYKNKIIEKWHILKEKSLKQEETKEEPTIKLVKKQLKPVRKQANHIYIIMLMNMKGNFITEVS